ncbi:Mis6-domain-containing protein [Jimgerdemannia flammicorona]|uniref:Mis6-domain-containing protein n=1 Tax=Jimgerdemannia flammicorona TaxID=994334 RepID=A0A433DIC0_9FUNG|nr:Mis6-domain-containing protein [Jimgerdemannia flammicorona]
MANHMIQATDTATCDKNSRIHETRTERRLTNMAATLNKNPKVRSADDIDDSQDSQEEYSLSSSQGEKTSQDEKTSQELEIICTYAGIKGNKTKVANSLTAIIQPVAVNGVEDNHIDKMLNAILGDEASSKRLAKLLLPRKRVREDHVVKILGSLSSGRKSVLTFLLRWVILIYDVLESTDKLRKLYGVIFHYLEFQTLSMDLHHRVGPEPAVIGLLSVYKDYYPNLVMTNIPPSKRLIFKCPDLAWQQSIQEIQAKWNAENFQFVIASHAPLQMGSALKRRKVYHVDVPTLKTLNVAPKSVTIEELSGFKDLARHIDRLELPNQLASVLDNRLLQHLVVCNPEETVIARISHWLGQCIMDVVFWRDQTAENRTIFGELLEKVVRLTEFTKELFPVFETFLNSYIRSWDGIEHQQEIFKLISFVRPTSYEDLYGRFLKPLHRLFYVSPALWKSKLILTCTEWLKNWSLHYWGGHSTRRRQQQGSEASALEDELEGMFAGLSFKIDYFKTMREFIMHVDLTCVMGLELENDDVSVQHATLSFFELVSSMSLEYNIPEIIIPSFVVVHRCFFSISGMAMSRMCGIVAQYKVAFEENERRKDREWASAYSREYVNHFNSFVMDICNCLWRNRGLNRTDKNASACLLSEGGRAAKQNLRRTAGQYVVFVLADALGGDGIVLARVHEGVGVAFDAEACGAGDVALGEGKCDGGWGADRVFGLSGAIPGPPPGQRVQRHAHLLVQLHDVTHEP